MTGRLDPAARAAGLIGLFCGMPREFGEVAAVSSSAVPPSERSLLDHRSHMTVTMERHHGCPVGLRVVAERIDAAHQRYAREILLTRSDGAVVQYGIVRIDLPALDPQVAAAILAKSAPLGRILMAAGPLCEVQQVDLLQIAPGPRLRDLTGGGSDPLYGRVAEIAVAGRPAIELLEIVVTPALACRS